MSRIAMAHVLEFLDYVSDWVINVTVEARPPLGGPNEWIESWAFMSTKLSRIGAAAGCALRRIQGAR
jgi:hypothetical protein